MYIVKYEGAFGFIKPWTAVRDGETFSQQFLIPSIIRGIELKLFPELLKNPGNNIETILRHRLSYESMSSQQEQIQSKGFEIKSIQQNKERTKDAKVKRYTVKRVKSILKRGILINPILYLGFINKDYALRASTQHICLCRNEDILLPDKNVLEMTEEEFNTIDGFELEFSNESPESFLVGFNRFKNSEKMYGKINVYGNPIRNEKEI